MNRHPLLAMPKIADQTDFHQDKEDRGHTTAAAAPQQ